MASVTEFRIPLELVCKQGVTVCNCVASVNLLDSVPAQKNATNFKLSIDSASEALEIGTLFPGSFCRPANLFRLGIDPCCTSDPITEIQSDNQTSLGLQPFCSEAAVSIFISTKNGSASAAMHNDTLSYLLGRYRVQSTCTDFMFVVFEELIMRIKKHQPNAKLHCSLPFPVFLTEINRSLEVPFTRNIRSHRSTVVYSWRRDASVWKSP